MGENEQDPKLLLMEEILHHLGCIKPCKQWYKLPSSTGYSRTSSINSTPVMDCGAILTFGCRCGTTCLPNMLCLSSFIKRWRTGAFIRVTLQLTWHKKGTEPTLPYNLQSLAKPTRFKWHCSCASLFTILRVVWIWPQHLSRSQRVIKKKNHAKKNNTHTSPFWECGSAFLWFIPFSGFWSGNECKDQLHKLEMKGLQPFWGALLQESLLVDPKHYQNTTCHVTCPPPKKKNNWLHISSILPPKTSRQAVHRPWRRSARYQEWHRFRLNGITAYTFQRQEWLEMEGPLLLQRLRLVGMHVATKCKRKNSLVPKL